MRTISNFISCLSFISYLTCGITRDLTNENNAEIFEVAIFPAFDQVEVENVKALKSQPNIIQKLEFLPKVGNFPTFEKDMPEPHDINEHNVHISVCKRNECADIKKFYNNLKESKRKKRQSSAGCDLKIEIEAFEKNYTLCLFSKDYKDEDIIKDKYDKINVTVFKEDNKTMEIPINTMDLEHIVGYVLDEPYSSANGFLIKHHFYGIVHIEDHIHFVEPSYKISKDLHIYKDGKDHLLNSLIHNKSAENLYKPKICELSIVADHHFYEQVGLKSVRNTIMLMLWHVKEANRFWIALDLNNDSLSDCLRLTIGEITVFTSQNSTVNLLTGNFNQPEDFLKRFSRYNFDGFCLGALFTSREFEDLVLGLAWRGNPTENGVGGICQRRVRIKTDANAYSFNALFVSLRSSQDKRIPVKMGVLNLVHEILHSFGGQHDPEPEIRADCTPEDKNINGRFLMSKFSNDGHKLNHQLLSPCTKELVTANLGTNTRIACLKESTGFVCGDGMVGGDEECDCGTVFMCTVSRSCCVPPEGMGRYKPCSWRKDVENCTRNP